MIYADHNASSPLLNEVKEYIINRINTGPFANPNSSHHLGAKIMISLSNARQVCSEILGATPDQIIFNSGATEGTTTIFNSILSETDSNEKPLIIISEIEHPATFLTALSFEKKGFSIQYVPTNENGTINLKELENIVCNNSNKIALIAIMAANNETGVIQPYKEIGKLAKLNAIPYFSDTTQLIGKLPFSFHDSNIDYAVMSGHKIGALTGAGILLAKDYSKIRPILLGGGQEKNLRSGTQNYLANETIAIALDQFRKNQNEIEKLKSHRDEFEKKLKKAHPELIVLGENVDRIPGTSYVSYPRLHGQTIQMELESKDIFVTTSSACSDDLPITSRVLKAMKVSDSVGRGGIRISFSLESNFDDFDKIYDALSSIYKKLLQIDCF